MFLSLHLLFLVAASVSASIRYNGIFRGLTHEDLVHVEDKVQTASFPPVPPQYTIDVPIDHFNKGDTRTYKNHYWVSSFHDSERAPRQTDYQVATDFSDRAHR